MHSGLPVKGYQPQPTDKVAIVNENKVLEERTLRQIDRLLADGVHDGRMLSIARTEIQAAFMWLNRAVFQPSRVELPEDGGKPVEFERSSGNVFADIGMDDPDGELRKADARMARAAPPS